MTLERTYVVPLRRGTMRATPLRRAKKAIAVLKKFITRHMKSEDIKISEVLNEHIWQNGMRNPIMKVEVVATKNKENVVLVRMSSEVSKEKAPKKPEAKSPATKVEPKAEKPVEKEAKVEAKPEPVKKSEEAPKDETPKTK
ncbi:MAG: large subunit ribosomal protein L31e [Candidatus Woesearchaeota archaeon]|jgi:large subunit ribosomal protein L31e